MSEQHDGVTLCKESEDWNWWLKLPQEVRGAAVSALRKYYQSAMGSSAGAQTLSECRDRLLPGLRSYATDDVELDINIDFAYDQLWVKAYNLKTHKSDRFFITRKMIADDAIEFGPNVRSLVEKCA